MAGKIDVQQQLIHCCRGWCGATINCCRGITHISRIWISRADTHVKWKSGEISTKLELTMKAPSVERNQVPFSIFTATILVYLLNKAYSFYAKTMYLTVLFLKKITTEIITDRNFIFYKIWGRSDLRIYFIVKYGISRPGIGSPEESNEIC